MDETINVELSEFERIVGSYATEVWRYLENHGSTTPLILKQELLISNSLLFLSLGWLLKEGKIEVDRIDNTYKVSIKK